MSGLFSFINVFMDNILNFYQYKNCKSRANFSLWTFTTSRFTVAPHCLRAKNSSYHQHTENKQIQVQKEAPLVCWKWSETGGVVEWSKEPLWCVLQFFPHFEGKKKRSEMTCAVNKFCIQLAFVNWRQHSCYRKAYIWHAYCMLEKNSGSEETFVSEYKVSVCETTCRVEEETSHLLQRRRDESEIWNFKRLGK